MNYRDTQPLDELFLDESDHAAAAAGGGGSFAPLPEVRIDVTEERKLAASGAPKNGSSVYAQYTYDWNMASSPNNPPVQGGLLVATPSLAVYEAGIHSVSADTARESV